MKNKEIISEIMNDLRALKLDDIFPKRYILSKLRSYASLLIRRENDQLRLWNYSDLWVTIDCLEMEEVGAKECCGIEIPSCDIWMKSVKKIPKLYSFKSGPLIREIYSMDRSQRFDLTSPRTYQNIMKREFINKSLKYAWIENDYLIIPKTQIPSISLTGLFESKKEALELSGCDDDLKDEMRCLTTLDEEFICPDHLLSTVKDLTMQSLLRTKSIPFDENSNLDSNVKQGKI